MNDMGEMSLTSSGRAKVLSFEEFTAAQQGGMTSPETNTPEPIEDEPSLDNVEVMDNPEEIGTEIPAPAISGENSEEPINNTQEEEVSAE